MPEVTVWSAIWLASSHPAGLHYALYPKLTLGFPRPIRFLIVKYFVQPTRKSTAHIARCHIGFYFDDGDCRICVDRETIALGILHLSIKQFVFVLLKASVNILQRCGRPIAFRCLSHRMKVQPQSGKRYCTKHYHHQRQPMAPAHLY